MFPGHLGPSQTHELSAKGFSWSQAQICSHLVRHLTVSHAPTAAMDRHDSSGQQQPPGPPASLPGSWLGAIYLADISSAPHFGATLGNFAQSAARPRAVSVSSARHSDVNTQPPGSDHGTLPVHHNLGEPLLGSARSEPVSQRWTTPGPQTSSSLAGQAGSPASTGSWPARQVSNWAEQHLLEALVWCSSAITIGAQPFRGLQKGCAAAFGLSGMGVVLEQLSGWTASA